MDLICAFAEQMYEAFIAKYYGVETCLFHGYDDVNNKYLKILLSEYRENKQECHTCKDTTCFCQQPSCDETGITPTAHWKCCN